MTAPDAPGPGAPGPDAPEPASPPEPATPVPPARPDGLPAAPLTGTPVLTDDGTTQLNGLLRLTALTTWRALAWTTGTVLSTGTQALTRALDGDPPVVILRDIAAEIRVTVVTALDGYGATPVARYGAEAGLLARDQRGVIRVATPAELRARGAALLDLSADVTATVDDAGHPAYARMLSELTPDEARILRLLYQAGPQPAIDIRTGRPLGIGSELVAGGLNMIAEQAGLRRLDRIYQYLTNLNRQGLVDFSKERVDDPGRYQLIEAQPNVTEARTRAGHLPKTVYRSIRLTAFGRDFCDACLPLDDDSPGPAWA